MQLSSVLKTTTLIVIGRILFNRSKNIRYIVRYTLFMSNAMINFTLAMIVSPVLYLTGNGYLFNYTLGILFKTLTPLMTGISYEIQGKEHLTSRPCILVSNHQSSLDMLPTQVYTLKNSWLNNYY